MPKRARIVIALLVLSGLGALIWWLVKPKDFLYAGTVEATEILLSSRVASVIGQIAVKEGDAVQAGQVLMTLTGEDLRVAADLAEKEYQRGALLIRKGALNQSELDQLRARRDQTALAVEWCTIKAPSAGRILYSFREPGEMVAPGLQLFTLGDLSEVYAFIYVEQPKLASLSLGKKVEGLLPRDAGEKIPRDYRPDP
jgi:multidrug resistance efflux pump